MNKLSVLLPILCLVFVAVTSYTYNFTLPLVAGWNLISTPLILDNSSIDNVIVNNDKITKIYYFDGDSWMTWISYISGNTLFTLEPLKGYWVYTTMDTNINFYGDPTIWSPPRPYGMSNPRSLSGNKWYLIGHYTSSYSDNINTDDALTSLCNIGGLCSEGYANFNFLLWYDTDNSLLNSTTQSSWSADALWDRGRGFWIRMTSADILIGTP